MQAKANKNQGEEKMIKVAMIGAGSIRFTRQLMMDILAVPEFRDTEFWFMDINKENLEMVVNLCRKMIKENNLSAVVKATTNQRDAVKDADYVFCTARVGGLEAYSYDIEIPLKYGVDQCVGDTLGPGGVFYALRTIPVLLDLAKDIRELSPNAVLFNYSNPMAMNCRAVHRAGGVKIIGLCHGVQEGQRQIAEALNIPEKELDFTCAGINHQSWFIEVKHNGIDLCSTLLEKFEKHPKLSVSEPVRIDVLKRFGYYLTESNGHLSEYLPWYRKRKDEINRWIYNEVWIGGRTAGYLNHCRSMSEDYKNMYSKWLSGEAEYIRLGERSVEYASNIIEALETGRMFRGHFNVANKGYITNLPNDCIVEIPCYVDANGIHPAKVGDIPMACAAMCQASISVQEMAVQAALTGDRELAKMAVLYDPLTAAICTPDEVWQMCDELFEALAQWLPQFNGKKGPWQDIPMPNDIF